MRKQNLLTIGTVVAAFAIASFAATPADARTVCKGSGVHAKCHKVTKKQTRHHYAYRTKARATARARRVARVERVFPWHGWAGSFHLEGVRYPGGNPSGPASSYNIFEGGFHPTVFWKLKDRQSY